MKVENAEENSFDHHPVRASKRESRHGRRWSGHHGQRGLKSGARKLRRLYNNKIVSGFAGSTADAFSLFARFEAKLEQHSGNLSRSVVELAKDWRTDKMLRHLEALLLVADAKNMYIVSGNRRCD